MTRNMVFSMGGRPLSGVVFMATMFAGAMLFGDDITIKLGDSKGRPVSPQLTGMNTVYAHEFMDTWADGGKIQSLKDAGISCLRYPGGHQTSFWDWEFPYHEPYQNFWDPAYIESLTPKKKVELKEKNGHRMGLDDYLNICAKATIEPIVGINMFQGYKFDRLDDSLAKAVRLVEYCKTQIPRVKYYFLDNEAGHQLEKGKHIPIDEYIKLIPAYSKAIKTVQPDAKIIVNLIHWGKVGEMIKKAGEHFDIVDDHWYYNNRKWGLFYIQDWRKENGNKKFANKLTQFRKWKKEAGKPDLELAFLEWNLGPATGDEHSDPASDLFQGLVQADMLMQFMNGDVLMAAAWPLTWAPRRGPGSFRKFLDHETGKASPSRHIFKWISMASGGRILECGGAPAGLRVAAVITDDGWSVLVYLLNKSTESQRITLDVGRAIGTASAKSFEEGSSTDDVRVRELETNSSERTLTLQIKETSFVFIDLELE